MAPPRNIIRLSLYIYLPMILSGWWVQAPGVLHVEETLPVLNALGLSMLLGLCTVAFSHFSSRHTAWGRRLHGEFHQVLGTLSSVQILVLALLSAFGEEILFRGVIHPLLGLFPTAMLFGLMHFPIRRAMLPWTAFAFVLGLVMALLTEWAQSLWPAIFLHFLVNYFNLHDLGAPLPPVSEQASATDPSQDENHENAVRKNDPEESP